MAKSFYTCRKKWRRIENTGQKSEKSWRAIWQRWKIESCKLLLRSINQQFAHGCAPARTLLGWQRDVSESWAPRHFKQSFTFADMCMQCHEKHAGNKVGINKRGTSNILYPSSARFSLILSPSTAISLRVEEKRKRSQLDTLQNFPFSWKLYLTNSCTRFISI